MALLLSLLANIAGTAVASDLQCPSVATMLVQFATDSRSIADLDPAIAQNCHTESIRPRSVVTIGIDAGVGLTPTYFLDPWPSMALHFPFSDNLVVLNTDSTPVRTDPDGFPQVSTQAQSRLQRCLRTRQFLQGLGLPGPVCNARNSPLQNETHFGSTVTAFHQFLNLPGFLII